METITSVVLIALIFFCFQFSSELGVKRGNIHIIKEDFDSSDKDTERLESLNLRCKKLLKYFIISFSLIMIIRFISFTYFTETKPYDFFRSVILLAIGYFLVFIFSYLIGRRQLSLVKK